MPAFRLNKFLHNGKGRGYRQIYWTPNLRNIYVDRAGCSVDSGFAHIDRHFRPGCTPPRHAMVRTRFFSIDRNTDSGRQRHVASGRSLRGRREPFKLFGWHDFDGSATAPIHIYH